MTRSVAISPLTRIEGHLAVYTDTEAAPETGHVRVTKARCCGEMFRGLETIMEGRSPLDAQQIMQRTCGVCPIPHAVSSCRAQEMAYGIQPNRNGRLLQNLILAANYLHSHVLHFYILSGLDFVDVKSLLSYAGADRVLKSLRAWVEDAMARQSKGSETFPAAPFLPRYEGDYLRDVGANCAIIGHYVEALDVRRIADEMAAVFGARLPHSTAIVPGGCTQMPSMERVVTYRSRLKRIEEFVENAYIPDVIAAAQAFPAYWDIGGGHGNLLSFGVFEMDDSGQKYFTPGVIAGGRWEALDAGRITEEVRYSKFSSQTGLHPSRGATAAQPSKQGAYSWIKAPRYGRLPMEVGPLARVMVGYHSPEGSVVKAEVDQALATLGVPLAKMVSVMGRHLCRAIESRLIVRQARRWLDEIEVGSAPARDFTLPKDASGFGLTEAPRGALGHWITIEDYKIKSYQCVVPTTWNCSPRDDNDVPGPVEKALEGVDVANPDQPIEVGRVVRSFDPCIACAVH